MTWHAALWATMKKYNICANLIRVVKHLYDEATSAVLFNGSIGDWFRTTVRVRLMRSLVTSIFSYACKSWTFTAELQRRLQYRKIPGISDKDLLLISTLKKKKAHRRRMNGRTFSKNPRERGKSHHYTTPYKDHVTNEIVRAKIQQAIVPYEDHLTIVKRHKLQCMDMSPVHQVWPKPSCKVR